LIPTLGSASTIIRLTADHKVRVSTAFNSLGSVFGAPLLPVINTGCIKRTSDDVVLDAWQILHASPSNEYDGVLLKIVPLARDVCGYVALIAQSHPTDLAERRIWLPWRHCTNLRTHTSLLGGPLELDSTLLQRVVRKLQIWSP